VTAAVGRITRGTTAGRRLRRVDRWLLARHPGLLRREPLVVADVGYGAHPVTTVELADRLRRVNAGVRVLAVEIDPLRIPPPGSRTHREAVARGIEFVAGGFDLGGRTADVIRLMNVLRQYEEAEVAGAWATVTAALHDGGVAIDGTCDETGSLGAWIALDHRGPQTLTLAVDLDRDPAAVATRLPKALIHHNVNGHPVHDCLAALSFAWRRHCGRAVFGRAERFAAAVADLRSSGWPVLDGPGRWRRGEVTLGRGAFDVAAG
jgi:hypothetical protein